MATRPSLVIGFALVKGLNPEIRLKPVWGA